MTTNPNLQEQSAKLNTISKTKQAFGTRTEVEFQVFKKNTLPPFSCNNPPTPKRRKIREQNVAHRDSSSRRCDEDCVASASKIDAKIRGIIPETIAVKKSFHLQYTNSLQKTILFFQQPKKTPPFLGEGEIFHLQLWDFLIRNLSGFQEVGQVNQVADGIPEVGSPIFVEFRLIYGIYIYTYT